MASNNIARLGVVLGIDTAEFSASIDRAIAVSRKLAAEVKRDMNAAAGEIVSLNFATQDYGKTLTKVELIERELQSGRFKSIDLTTTMKSRLLDAAAAYDSVAASTAAATKAAADNDRQQAINKSAKNDLTALLFATQDYGKELTKVQQIERETQSGRLQGASGGLKADLLNQAAAYDAVALAAQKEAQAVQASNAIKNATGQGERELVSLKYAVEDYGKTVTRVTQMERAFSTGHLQLASPEVKAALLAEAAAFDKLAVSTVKASVATAGLTGQQKLNMQYQITDFVTQVASGQGVLIPLIQQGGQLKDSMGGVANAFKALGTLITPVSVAVGAFAVVVGSAAFAAFKGKLEYDDLRDSISLTGNYAKVSTDDFQRMAVSISDSTHAGIGQVKDVLSAMVASGQFTKDTFSSVATAIVKFSEVSGLTHKEAADKLIPSLDGTSESLRRMNAQYNFLTLAQYKHLDALSLADQKQKVIKESADLLKESFVGQQRQLGFLDSGLEKTTKLWQSFWDAMKGFGTPESTEIKIKAITAQISILEDRLVNNPKLKNLPETIKRLKEELFDLQLDQTSGALADKTKEDAKRRIEIEARDKAQHRQKQAEADQSAISLKYAQEEVGQNDFTILALEYHQKIDKLRAASAAKNIAEEGRFTIQNKKILDDQLLQGTVEYLKAKTALEMKHAVSRQGAKEQMTIERLAVEAEHEAIKQRDIAFVKSEGERIELGKIVLGQSQAVFMLENSGKAIRAEDLTLAKEELDLRSQLVIKLREMDILRKDTGKNPYKSEDQYQEAIATEQELTNIAVKYARERNKKVKDLRGGAFGEGIGKAADNFLVNITTDMENGQKAFDSVMSNMGTALDNFVKTGKLNFKDFAGSVIRDLIAIQLKASATGLMSMLLKTVFSAATGGNMSENFTQANISGNYASGGSPAVGRASLVGEKGPELFVPSGSGTIIPNNQLAGGTTNVTNNYINAIDTKSFEDRLLGSSNAVWAANMYANKSLAVGKGRS